MRKNSLKNIIRVCYFTFYAIIFLFALFIFFKDKNLVTVPKIFDSLWTFLYLVLFIIFYILTAGLSTKDNLKTSILQFGGYVLGFSFLVSFLFATLLYLAGGGEAGWIYIFGAPILAGATFIAGIIWFINMARLSSKTIIQKNKKILYSLLSFLLVLVLIFISNVILGLGMFTTSYFLEKQHEAREAVSHIIYSQQNCKIDSDCIYFYHPGNFWGPVNQENWKIAQQKADEYCKKYSHDCQFTDTGFFEKKTFCVKDLWNKLACNEFISTSTDKKITPFIPKTQITLSGVRGDEVEPGPIEETCNQIMKNYIKENGSIECKLIESKVGWKQTHNEEECPNGFSPQGCYICKLECN